METVRCLSGALLLRVTPSLHRQQTCKQRSHVRRVQDADRHWDGRRGRRTGRRVNRGHGRESGSGDTCERRQRRRMRRTLTSEAGGGGDCRFPRSLVLLLQSDFRLTRLNRKSPLIKSKLNSGKQRKSGVKSGHDSSHDRQPVPRHDSAPVTRQMFDRPTFLLNI